ncbi:MAG: hypothetical protein ACK5OC_07865 [Pirellula sp.]
MNAISWQAVICVFLGSFTPVANCTAQLPPSAETIISDARGFGALKLLNTVPGIQAKIGLDDTMVNELKALGEKETKRFEELDRQTVRGLIRDRKSVAGSRELVVEQLDREIENRLEEILSPDLFQKFSRYVVADRLSPHTPMSIVLRPGTTRYLGLDEKSLKEVQQRIDKFLATEGNAAFYRRNAFSQLIKTAPSEFRNRVVDLVGTKFLPDEHPSGSSPPILDAPFRYYTIMGACAKEFSPEIFGNNPRLTDELHKLMLDLHARSNSRGRKEQEEAFIQGRAIETQRIQRENDEMSATAIRRVLNHEQLILFSQFGMSGSVSSSIRSFFANQEVQKYLNDPQTTSELLVEADRIDKEANDLAKNFIVKVITDYIESLGTETIDRLRNLIDIE